MKSKVLSAALLMVAAGCGKGGGGEAAVADAGAGKPDPAVQQAEVAAVAAKVPAGLTLAFEAVPGEKERHLAIQPKGWETGVIPGRVKPPAGSSLGFMTAFSTGSNCDGSCEPKDWKAVADKVEFAQFSGGPWTIEKDEQLGGEGGSAGRLLVARGEDRVDIALALWKEGASRYFVCRATLDKELVAAAPAFEEACRRMKVLSW